MIRELVDIDLAPIAELIQEPLGARHIFRGNQRVKDQPLVVDVRRLRAQAMEPEANRQFWRRAGFVTSLWGYDRRQSYLDRVPD